MPFLRTTLFALIASSALNLPADAQEGAALYQQYCATCHGSDLKGGLGPSLVDDVWTYGSRPEEQARVIHDGVPENGMPPFGTALASNQIGAIVSFVQAAAVDPNIAPSRVVDSLSTLDYALNVEIFADDLEIPWAIDFIDAGTALITERPGRLRVVRDGVLQPDPIEGTPEVLHAGQGGMLDVTVDPDYSDNGWIYLAYSHPLSSSEASGTPAMTRIVRGRIADNRWVDEEVLFEAPHETYRSARQHFGSRIVFDPDGYLFFSIGDRGAAEQAQDLGRPNGKMHRIHPDGSIPADNPFLNVPGALPSVYSYGHRNPQGVAVHPETGDVWAVEHGPLGGDELNRVQPATNYGWPVISYGINYDGSILTEHRVNPEMEQPVLYWRPSIAVSGLAFYDHDAFPLWRGHLLVGALRYEEVRLLHLHGNRVLHQEIILKDQGRVREAAVGPDGAIYVVLNDPDRVIRLTPRAQQIRGR